MVQVSNGFNQCKAVFPLPDLATEQDGKAVGRLFGFVQPVYQTRQRIVVILFHLTHAGRQTGKGQLVPRQHQMVLSGHRTKPLAGLDPVGERVRLWLGGVDANVGADRADDRVLIVLEVEPRLRRWGGGYERGTFIQGGYTRQGAGGGLRLAKRTHVKELHAVQADAQLHDRDGRLWRRWAPGKHARNRRTLNCEQKV